MFCICCRSFFLSILASQHSSCPHVYVRLQTHFMQCTDETYSSEYSGGNAQFAHSGCNTFQDPRPMTMALSVLVIIELLNALNRSTRLHSRFASHCSIVCTCMYMCVGVCSVSEDQSIFSMPPWVNLYLIGADTLSLVLHFAILYVPVLAVCIHSVDSHRIHCSYSWDVSLARRVSSSLRRSTWTRCVCV